jgi:hypothetical protein
MLEKALSVTKEENSPALISSTKRTAQFEKFEQFLTDV